MIIDAGKSAAKSDPGGMGAVRRRAVFGRVTRRLFPLAAAPCLCLALSARAEPAAAPVAATPTEVVQAYVNAANAGDLEAFLALYASDITKYTFPGTRASQGIAHMREVYTRSFAAKAGIHVEIVSMIALGDKVVSRDRVTGLPGGATADELTIYQVQGGRITNMVYVDQVGQ